MYDVTKRELDSVKKQLQELEEEHKLTVEKVRTCRRVLSTNIRIAGTYGRHQKSFRNVIIVQ